jgi:hypothetical protein
VPTESAERPNLGGHGVRLATTPSLRHETGDDGHSGSISPGLRNWRGEGDRESGNRAPLLTTRVAGPVPAVVTGATEAEYCAEPGVDRDENVGTCGNQTLGQEPQQVVVAAATAAGTSSGQRVIHQNGPVMSHRLDPAGIPSANIHVPNGLAGKLPQLSQCRRLGRGDLCRGDEYFEVIQRKESPLRVVVFVDIEGKRPVVVAIAHARGSSEQGIVQGNATLVVVGRVVTVADALFAPVSSNLQVGAVSA